MAGRRLLIVTVIAVLSSHGRADVRFVDDDASPGGDGVSWGTAYRFLQDALHNASNDVTINEIRIGQGTYQPDRDEAGDVTPGDRAASFGLLDGVAILGGFAGIGAADPDERDPALFTSILTGDLLGNDEPGFLFNDENSLHVTTGSGTDTTAVLDGVTITAGNADSDPESAGAGMIVIDGSPSVIDCRFRSNAAVIRGAGMSNQNSSPTITGCIFSRNAASDGAGMHNENSSPSVTDCGFDNNNGSSGAGMQNDAGSNPVVVECRFVSNGAVLGGGMLNFQSSPTLTGCLFSINNAAWGGGMLNIGGSNPRVTGCTFTGNTAGGNGGGLINLGNSLADVVNCVFTANVAEFGGGAFNGESDATFQGCTFGGPDPADGNAATATGGGMYNFESAPVVTGCAFTGNTANFAGGMFNDVSNPLVTDCTFSVNTAATATGAMGNFEGAAPTVINCTFTQNSAPQGGAIRNFDNGAPVLFGCLFDGNTAIDEGGAMVNLLGSNPTLTSCLFVGNSTGGFGGAIQSFDSSHPTLVNVALIANSAAFAGGAISTEGPGPTLINCTVAANTATILGGGLFGGSPVLANCIVRANTNGQIEGASPVASFSNVQGGLPGPGNIDADALFVDPPGGDYRLLPGSPSIDAGHNWSIAGIAETDLDGNPRFAADRNDFDPGCGVPVVVDMGAYEFQGDPFPVKLGDIDGDGTVGITDFLALLGDWGACAGQCCLADLDLDTDVGITDFLILLANWG